MGFPAMPIQDKQSAVKPLRLPSRTTRRPGTTAAPDHEEDPPTHRVTTHMGDPVRRLVSGGHGQLDHNGLQRRKRRVNHATGSGRSTALVQSHNDWMDC